MSLRLLIATASAQGGSLFGQVIPWLLALLAVVIVGGAGIWLVRRVLKQDARADAGGFTLQDLRDMKAAGQLSDEEFERARDSIIGRLSEPSAAEHEPKETTDS